MSPQKSTKQNCFILVVLIYVSHVAHGNGIHDKPNIVLVLADDLGCHQVGCYGSQFYETPFIDQLAGEGMRFTNAYAAAPICSPTRASLMTGKYPARLHLTNFLRPKSPTDRKLVTPDWATHLLLDETTVAESLKMAGYVCGHFGKWHLNIDKKYEPSRAGDPGSQGFDDVLTTHKPNAGRSSKYDNDWHHVREITGRATAFIQRNQQRPFFCYVSHNSIHDPEQEAASLIEKYQRKPASGEDGNNPKQAAMLETLDASLGSILTTIDELGLSEDTIVIFFSDNGHLGPKTGKPFRGSKGDLYEGGIRMPLLIRWPSVIKRGRLCHELVISNDFFSTFNELAGFAAPPGNSDGVSLVPVLNNAEASLGRDTLYWHFPHYHVSGISPQGAMREGRYKLIEWFEKSIDDQPDAFELYDLIDDPAETTNLADLMPEFTGLMRMRLEDWRDQVGAQSMTIRQK